MSLFAVPPLNGPSCKYCSILASKPNAAQLYHVSPGTRYRMTFEIFSGANVRLENETAAPYALSHRHTSSTPLDMKLFCVRCDDLLKTNTVFHLIQPVNRTLYSQELMIFLNIISPEWDTRVWHILPRSCLALGGHQALTIRSAISTMQSGCSARYHLAEPLYCYLAGSRSVHENVSWPLGTSWMWPRTQLCHSRWTQLIPHPPRSW